MSEFLAEASVLVRANTEAFRAELLAEVKAAVAAAAKIASVPITPVITPVVSTAGVGTASAVMSEQLAVADRIAKQFSVDTLDVAAASNIAAGALERQAASAGVTAVSMERTGAASAAIARVNQQLAVTAAAFAKAQQTVSASTGATVSPLVQARRATLALAEADKLIELVGQGAAVAQERLAIALRASVLSFQQNATAAAESAAAQEASAVSARHNAVAMANAARGSATAGLAAAGLRGATLTANAGFIAGAAAAIIFGKSLQSITNFQTNLNVFAATVGATGAEMAKVSAVAKQLGRDVTLPAVSAQDAASAMTELAKAGLSVQDSIDGARGVLQLATAAAIDNAQATELAASALNAFGLSGDQAVHVADVLTNAANESQGSIVDMGFALSQAASVARQAGLSLETTAAVLTLFARNGLRGSDAGTSLRTALIRLINPTDKAAKVIKDLGLNLRTATGSIDITVFDQFARATRNMTAAQRDQALAVIFGQDAIRGAAILAREGATGLNAQTNAMNKSGSAAELAAARTKGLAGAFENAKNQAAAFGLTIGQLASGPVAELITGAGNLFESLNTVAQKIGDFVSPKVDVTSGSIETLIANVKGLQQASAFSPDFAPAFEKALPKVEQALAEAGKRLVAQGFLTRFIETFSAASPQVKKAMEDNVITPSEQAAVSATAIGRAFLAALPHTSEFFESFGVSAKSGIEDAAAAVRAGGPELASAMRSTVEDSAAQAKAQAAVSGTQVGVSFSAAVAAAVKAGRRVIDQAFGNAARSARLGAASASSELIDLEFRGATDQQILAVLKRKKERQDRLVATLEARPGAKRVNIEKAKQDAIATQNEIETVQARIDAARDATVRSAKQAAADRAAKAKAVADANNAADQAILNSFAGGQNRIDLATISANATAGLNDDIALQVLIANTASKEIAIIEKMVKDVETRNAAIAERVKTLKEAGAEIDRLRKERDDALAEKKRQAREEITSTLEKRLQLAQIIGKRDPILAAFNALIANERKNLAAAKKADKLDALIKLQQTIKERNDFLEQITKDAQDAVGKGTTAFDLLKQFTDTFNQNAGNLVGPDQPFIGPTGFTSAITPFLVRRPAPAVTPTTGTGGKNIFNLNDRDLIAALDRLTQATLEKTGNQTAGTRRASVEGQRWAAVGRFWEARQTRQAVEAESA